jgi:hypothetical protein
MTASPSERGTLLPVGDCLDESWHFRLGFAAPEKTFPGRSNVSEHPCKRWLPEILGSQR